MKSVNKKILIAGVGGQGVVYLTNLLVEAAVLADIPVATSEIHGLAQRGGSVTASLTFGENTYGFIEKAGADFLIGLEVLEAQRNLPYLNKNSRAVIDSYKILPYSVNAKITGYPDTQKFINYLEKNIAETIFISEVPKEVNPILRNIFVLGCASCLKSFPVTQNAIEKAIKNAAKADYQKQSLQAFSLGRDFHKRAIVCHE